MISQFGTIVMLVLNTVVAAPTLELTGPTYYLPDQSQTVTLNLFIDNIPADTSSMGVTLICPDYLTIEAVTYDAEDGTFDLIQPGRVDTGWFFWGGDDQSHVTYRLTIPEIVPENSANPQQTIIISTQLEWRTDDRASTTDPAIILINRFAGSIYHSADVDGSGSISLTELLRVIQLFNIGAYEVCPNEGTEDGFCPILEELKDLWH